jgi:hypothetical protein
LRRIEIKGKSKGAGTIRANLPDTYWNHPTMHTEKIPVRITQTGQMMDVVVFDKRADHITVVLGEGMHSVKCELTPTRTGQAYAGSAMGREIVYERSRTQVQADLDRLNPTLRQSTRKKT